MSYRDTARAFAQAESNLYSPRRTLAADKLPMSDWAEDRRDLMSPQTIAQNHALHVAEAVCTLREALATAVELGHHETGQPTRYPLKDAARALLAAIGEGGDA